MVLSDTWCKHCLKYTIQTQFTMTFIIILTVEVRTYWGHLREVNEQLDMLDEVYMKYELQLSSQVIK